MAAIVCATCMTSLAMSAISLRCEEAFNIGTKDVAESLQTGVEESAMGQLIHLV